MTNDTADADTMVQDSERAAVASDKFSLMLYETMVQGRRFDTVGPEDQREHFEWSKGLAASQARVLAYTPEFLAHRISGRQELLADVASDTLKADIQTIDTILAGKIGNGPAAFEERRKIISRAAKAAAFATYPDGDIFDRDYQGRSHAASGTDQTMAMTRFLLAPGRGTGKSLPHPPEVVDNDLPPKDAKALFDTIGRVQPTLLGHIHVRSKVFNSATESVEHRLYLIGNDLDAMESEVEIVNRWINSGTPDQRLTELHRKTASMQARFSDAFPNDGASEGPLTQPEAEKRKRARRQ
jgi:hypothetical protein